MTRQLLSPTVPELIKKYGPKVAIVGSDYNYPHYYAGIAKDFVARAGGSVVAEEYSPLGQTDWQPVIKRLAAAKPDVLLSMVVGADAVSSATSRPSSSACSRRPWVSRAPRWTATTTRR